MNKKKTVKSDLDERYWRLVRRISGNIQRIREDNDLTQEDMHDLGFERRWYQRIESGRHSISLPTLEKIARALKVDIVEFFK